MFAFVLLPALPVFVLTEPDELPELPLLELPPELPLPDELPPLELLPPPELPPELLLPELLPPPDPLLLPPPELPLDLLLIFTVLLMPSTHLPVAST